MKNSILILVDLSENTVHVAEMATIIAGQLQKNLLLLNCNETISAVTYYPIVPVMSEAPTWLEDREVKLQILSDHLNHHFEVSFPGQPKPVIKTLIREGDLYANIKELLKELPIDFIAMGGRSGSSVENYLFGSDTKVVTDHAPIPVLIIPKTSKLRHVKKITFATNLIKQDIAALQFLVNLRNDLGAQLEIVHIKKYGETSKPKNSQVQQAITETCAPNSPVILYNEVYGKHIVSRLNAYCKGNGSDIIALSHAHHSFLFRALREGTVDQSLSDHQIPLLIIPELKAEKGTHTDSIAELSSIVLSNG